MIFNIITIIFIALNGAFKPMFIVLGESNQPEIIDNDEFCYQPFGCFPNTANFVHTIYRPMNLYPQNPKIVDTKFYLYSRWLIGPNITIEHCGNQSIGLAYDFNYMPCLFTTNDLLSMDKINNNKLQNLSKLKKDNGKKDAWTAFIVHGFLDDLNESNWMTRIKDRLLNVRSKQQYEMVILVDWKGGNGIPYLQATSNTRLVGSQITFFIKHLRKYLNIGIDRTHIIGHSLGAHIAGYAGKLLQNPKLGRITALDPAGPNFNGMPKTVRIDRDDAQFIDVIHTNGKPLYLFGYGMQQAIGHIDFYPNGGIDQPGCEVPGISTVFDQLIRNNGFLSNIDQMSRTTSNFIICSHVRAIALFIESIPIQDDSNQCNFTSVRSSNRMDTNDLRRKLKNCPNTLDCAQMGFNSYQWFERISSTLFQEEVTFKYYLDTNAKPFYCKTII